MSISIDSVKNCWFVASCHDFNDFFAIPCRHVLMNRQLHTFCLVLHDTYMLVVCVCVFLSMVYVRFNAQVIGWFGKASGCSSGMSGLVPCICGLRGVVWGQWSQSRCGLCACRAGAPALCLAGTGLVLHLCALGVVELRLFVSLVVFWSSVAQEHDGKHSKSNC